MANVASDIALELARKICKLIDSHTEWSSPETEIAALLRPHVWDWIPVGERLPDEDTRVLFVANCEADDCGGITHYFREVYAGTIYKTPLQLIATSDDGDEYENKEVIAWAALPSAPLSLESTGETK